MTHAKGKEEAPGPSKGGPGSPSLESEEAAEYELTPAGREILRLAEENAALKKQLETADAQAFALRQRLYFRKLQAAAWKAAAEAWKEVVRFKGSREAAKTVEERAENLREPSINAQQKARLGPFSGQGEALEALPAPEGSKAPRGKPGRQTPARFARR